LGSFDEVTRRLPDILPFRELEALSRSRLPVLLTFFHARIAGEKSFLLQYTAQFRAELDQSPRNAVLYSIRLAMHTSAIHRDQDVKFAECIGRLQGPLDQHLVGLIEEILL